MAFLTTDTIFAPATAPGRAGVAVIRISGEKALAALMLFGIIRKPTPRLADLVALRHPETGEILDRGLLLWFPAPHSFTGEDTIEFQLHGSRAVMAELTRLLANHPDFRMAEAGEFTRRAVLNGKLDLTQAEALVDLVDAETTAQLRMANRQLSGQLSKVCSQLRDEIIAVRAYVEALLDFSDEELPDDAEEYIQSRLQTILASLSTILNDNRVGERLRDGVHAAIIGIPNAGKSTFLNWLAGRDVAIVSDEAGTTRDVLELHLNLSGYPLILADTAGIRESDNKVEAEGIRRAMEKAKEVDFRIVILDASKQKEEQSEIHALIKQDDVVLLNKIDMNPQHIDNGMIPVSFTNETNLEAIIPALESKLAFYFNAGSDALITRERHRIAFENAHNFIFSASAPVAFEMRGELLRLASRELSSITGEINIEHILDRLFTTFCIGK